MKFPMLPDEEQDALDDATARLARRIADPTYKWPVFSVKRTATGFSITKDGWTIRQTKYLAPGAGMQYKSGLPLVPKLALAPPESPVERAKRHLAILAVERKNDREPSWRDDPVGRMGWSQREESRRERERRALATLRDYSA